MRRMIGFALAAAALLACGDNSQGEPPLGPVEDVLEYTDPTIGTGGFGFAYGSAFVGAAAPHGLVKLGPDTSGEFGTLSFQHFSGYYADDDVIESFSHLHFHGTGQSDYGVIGVMPTTRFDPTKTDAEDYRSTFSKETELARAGRYEVVLESSGVRAELTATTRAAHHRYTATDGAAVTVVIDLTRSLEGEVTDISIDVDADAQTITGSLHNTGPMSGGFDGYDVFFVARTRAPWTAETTWAEGAALEFAAGEAAELQIGVSLVSAEGALANLESELPAWDFEATAETTAQAWRDRLGAIIVEGGTRETRRMFYSALYRSFLMPTIISDGDGQYIYEGERRATITGDMHSDLSLWDTYRTLHPLYHLIAPESGADSVRSLVAMSEAGNGFPRWPMAVGESGTMLGASADVVLADATLKLNIEGFDPEATLDDLIEIAMDPGLAASERGGRNPADGYIEHGYVPSTDSRSVSTNLEFAVDDYALARMAEELGRDQVAAALDARAASYKELFDPETQTFRPRHPESGFPSAEDYDPLYFGDEFAEANALQMLWAPLHDVDGLSELLGGSDVFTLRLESFFDLGAIDLVANPLDSIPANAAPRPHYWHGNEPDIHAAYLFAQVGRDDLTQRWLEWITTELYNDQPWGLAGNDDGGTLSSWYVWTAMGIYPVAGSNRYFVGKPMFPRMTITTTTGTLTIEAPGADQPGAGVAGVTVNGRALERAELAHDDLAGTATVSFDIVSEPTAWSR